jgi:hypothetical protein
MPEPTTMASYVLRFGAMLTSVFMGGREEAETGEGEGGRPGGEVERALNGPAKIGSAALCVNGRPRLASAGFGR